MVITSVQSAPEVLMHFMLLKFVPIILLLLFICRWSYLEVTTNPIHSDLHQAYTAGFGEGLITSYLIDLHFHNTIEGTCVEPLSVECRKLKYFVDINAAWIQHNIDELADSDPYWHQASLTQCHLMKFFWLSFWAFFCSSLISI
jgi:hypothetical protein